MGFYGSSRNLRCQNVFVNPNLVTATKVVSVVRNVGATAETVLELSGDSLTICRFTP